jgi:hypothetical protein
VLQWWPGRIGQPVLEDGQVKRSENGDLVYTINYEAYEEFDAEMCEAAFITPRESLLRYMKRCHRCGVALHCSACQVTSRG